MKKVFRLAPLAAAVAALSVSGMALASDHRDEGAHMSKHIDISKRVVYEGDVEVDGEIYVNSLGMAVIDQEQDSDYNLTENDRVDNDAVMDENALKNGKGNIGVNISAGDSNVQSNAAALAATDAKFVFGSADSEIFMDQNAEGNFAYNMGTINTAALTGSALENARGNIGVNIASGSSNVQANSFAASVASGSMGEATVSVQQETENNSVINVPEEYQETVALSTSVDVSAVGSYSGGSTGGQYGGTTFTDDTGYKGTSDQIGDLYLDSWSGANHPGGSNTGHIDVDSAVDGAQDLNQDGGAFAFNEEGEIKGGTNGGSIAFSEAGSLDLAGVVTVTQEQLLTRYNRHHNDASFSGDALKGARGNIGINITAGNSNLQNNSLAMNKVDALDVVAPTPPPTGETTP